MMNLTKYKILNVKQYQSQLLTSNVKVTTLNILYPEQCQGHLGSDVLTTQEHYCTPKWWGHYYDGKQHGSQCNETFNDSNI